MTTNKTDRTLEKENIIKSRLHVNNIKPNLGFLSVAFATFLTILNTENRSNNLIEATNDLSIGIMLIVATIFLSSFEFKNANLLFFNSLLNNFIQLYGYFFSCKGIYHCFYEVSPIAADNLKQIGLMIFLLIVIQTFLSNYYKSKEEIKQKT